MEGMGADGDGGIDDLDRELEQEGVGASGAGQETSIKITVFIGFDEDDGNTHGIDLNDLFQNDKGDKPYYVEVSLC